MDRLTRYILRQLLVGTIIVAVALTGVIWLSQSLRMIDIIVNRGLPVVTFFKLTVLLLPNFMTMILPVALFVVVLFTYSKLITDQELVVMRSAGIGPWGLARPAVIAAAGLVGILYLLNLYLVPASYKAFRDWQWNIRYSYAHIALVEGTFNTVVDGVTVYVRERIGEGELRGLMIHDERDPERPATIVAARGGLVESEDGPQVVLFDGNRQEVERGTDAFSILFFDRYGFDLAGEGNAGIMRHRKARERGLGELLDIEGDAFLDPRDYGSFRVEAHRRLTSPLQPLTFAVVGLACLIAGGTSRSGHSLRLTTAVLLVVLIQAASLGLNNLCARYPDLIPLIYALAVLPLGVGLAAMGRSPRRLRLPAVLRRVAPSA